MKKLTKDSVQCKNTTKTEVKLCYLHNPNYVKPSKALAVLCNGTTEAGKNCKNKTKDASKLCHNHRKN